MITRMYPLLQSSLANKEADLNSDTLKVALHTSAYTPNFGTHQYWDTHVTNQCAGTGYTAGGATIGSPTFSYDSGAGLWKLDGNDVTWPSNTVLARYGIVYDATPGSSKPLICCIDFEADTTPLGIQWHADGILVADFNPA